MKPPKDRSIPLTAAMARFVDVADLVRSRAGSDDVLRDLCEDYRLARELLLKAKKEKPRSPNKMSQYTSLVDDLEDEIMRYLVSEGGPSKHAKGD